ncbi:alpha/beta hydrolase [Deltaproteobacteria bacterium]|nr:alpha/beta hydrolase [Deltaproteobacteria bacterium]
MWLVATGGLYVGQRKLLFPSPPPAELPVAQGLTRTDLSVDGAPVPMWWSTVPGAPTVLFFHGNAAQLAGTLPEATAAMVAGLGFAAIEYPGYGLAPAEEPSEEGCFAAGRAAISALADLGVGPPVCVGHSLGAGVAAAMAAEGRCSALVLAAPFTSVLDMAALQYPWLPTSRLVKDPFDSLGRASQIAIPTLVIHSRDDGIIPFAMGEALAAAIPGARLLPRNAGHNAVLDAESWVAIASFVQER